MKKLWRRWDRETKDVLNAWTPRIFAVLVLNFLILANVAAVAVILAAIRALVRQ